jgi:predicted deacylase
MYSAEPDTSHVGPNTLLCSRGSWIYTRTGGVLEVYPQVNTIVRKGDLIARIKNIFGNIVDEILAPAHGVVLLVDAGYWAEQ